MESKKNSQARIAANNRYNAKAYDRINIAVPKGRKEAIQLAAKARGESINAFINRLIDAELEQESSTGRRGDGFENMQAPEEKE